ncbi:hypothetical protein [Paenibacillus massiliensis]|uniref:hypothetical protein n=1 Tax=Paenibacillus massiliensis TaxID=225917 RepID=UPI000422D104|nr:hypothetical protein [Paenibacillus massiliensis]
MDMRRMAVTPMQVPWMISPSYDFATYRGDDRQEVRVQMMCGYSSKHFEKIISELSLQYHGDIPDEEYNNAGSALVEITFAPVLLFSVYSKLREWERYDYSYFEPYTRGERSLREEWNYTGMCPNPGFYEVINSPLRAVYGFTSPKIRHWVLSAHDSYIDVLAHSFAWQEVGSQSEA